MLEEVGLIAQDGQLSEILKEAPPGEYRVIIYNPATHEEKLIDDYPDYNQAIKIAKEKGSAEQANAFVYNDNGDCLYTYFKE